MSEKSFEHLNQSLCSLMDNDVSELETRRVLRAIADENASCEAEELRAKWRRYHLASSVLRKDSVVEMRMGVDFASSVRDAIGKEKAYSFEQQPSNHVASRRSWKELVLQTSVAATVAVGCVLGFQQFAGNQSEFKDAIIAERAESGLDQSQQTLVRAASQPVFAAPEGFDVSMPRATAVSTATSDEGEVSRPLSQAVQSVLEQREQQRLLQLHFRPLMHEHAKMTGGESNLGFLPYARVPGSQQLK